MRVWTMRDLGGLMENLDSMMYVLQVAVEEGDRGGISAALKGMRSVMGCMEECVEEAGRRGDEER